jgi:predicted AAA+ superfamily ATPase
VLQRDVRDLAQIEGLTQLPQLLNAIAQKTTGSLNAADISRSLGIPQTSLKRYLTLLEAVYLIESVPAWTHRDSHRAQKAANYYLNDSGLFAYVMGMTEKSQAASPVVPLISLNGALVETFVQSELRKQLGWSDTSAQLLHYRTSTGMEVDFVLEDKAGNIVGIEVKSSLTVGSNDFKGLRHLRELLGDKFIRGIVLHPGDNAVQWDTELSSIPMSCFY